MSPSQERDEFIMLRAMAGTAFLELAFASLFIGWGDYTWIPLWTRVYFSITFLMVTPTLFCPPECVYDALKGISSILIVFNFIMIPLSFFIYLFNDLAECQSLVASCLYLTVNLLALALLGLVLLILLVIGSVFAVIKVHQTLFGEEKKKPQDTGSTQKSKPEVTEFTEKKSQEEKPQ